MRYAGCYVALLHLFLLKGEDRVKVLRFRASHGFIPSSQCSLYKEERQMLQWFENI
jgi:hypothetical protein